jgi:hypothetical protein
MTGFAGRETSSRVPVAVSASLPDSKAAPQSARSARPRQAALATGLIGGAAAALGLLLLFAPPLVALVGCVPCCLSGAVGCELLARLNLTGPRDAEPWRLDAWATFVGGLSALALGVSVGPQTKPLGWLLFALLVSLALAAFGAGRPPKRDGAS